MRASALDPQEVRTWMESTFDVDADAGVLTWRVAPKNHPRMAGRPAGCSRPNQSNKRYVYVKKDRMALRRGWLIFLWVNYRWPADLLDHIDGNSMNDSRSNLREATVTQNAWNHKRRAKRSTLPMGVRIIPKSGRYQARIAVNKRMLHLGAFDTPQEAQTVYLAKRKELFGEFA